MSRVIEEVSKITAKGQTTIPKAVRQALGVGYGGCIAFRIEEGRVSVERVSEEHHDPLVGSFLTFLEKDLRSHPERIESLSSDVAKRISALTTGVDVDLDAPIEGDVEI
jgi:antitoxin PrlF